jgi:flagellar assembly protein FliH
LIDLERKPDSKRVGVLRPASAMTAASFSTVGELAAEISPDDFRIGLPDHELRRLDNLAAKGYQDGYEEGRRAGFESGQLRANQEISTRMTQTLKAVASAAAQLAAQDAVTLAELDDQVASFAVDVVATLLGRELAMVADPGAAAIARAVALAPARGDLVARLNPADVAKLGEVADLAPGRPLTIVSDASVEQGGCIVEVGPCRIDAQLSPALVRVKQVLGMTA